MYKQLDNNEFKIVIYPQEIVFCTGAVYTINSKYNIMIILLPLEGNNTQPVYSLLNNKALKEQTLTETTDN